MEDTDKKAPVEHGDETAPAGFVSPGTFVPLSKEPQGCDQKTERGKTGKD